MTNKTFHLNFDELSPIQLYLSEGSWQGYLISTRLMMKLYQLESL